MKQGRFHQELTLAFCTAIKKIGRKKNDHLQIIQITIIKMYLYCSRDKLVTLVILFSNGEDAEECDATGVS